MKSPGTPHTPSLPSVMNSRRKSAGQQIIKQAGRPPRFLVLDFLYVSHLDASATRGCFLQLVKLCAKQDIVVCASGVTPRIEWMFRTHGVAYKTSEEGTAVAARLQSKAASKSSQSCDNALLFVSVQDALEFCENAILHEFRQKRHMPVVVPNLLGPKQQSFPNTLARILKATDEEKTVLSRLEEAQRYHDEREMKAGEVIFHKNTHSDSFFVVLHGSVANTSGSARAVDRFKQQVFSGAGRVGSRSDLLDEVTIEQRQNAEASNFAAMVWNAGSVVGYLDFLLDRPRSFRAVAKYDGTRVAQITFSHMNLLQSEDHDLYLLIQRVLLHASTQDLANCTCNYEVA